MIDYSQFALSKPPKRPRQKPSHAIYRDGQLQRIVLNKTDWAKLRDWVWEVNEQIFGAVVCHLCKERIKDKIAYELDHIFPRKSGGSARDDRFCKPSHAICNRVRGSRRIA